MRKLAFVLAVWASVFSVTTPVQGAFPGQTFTETGCEAYSDSIGRLYSASFGRSPEPLGFEFWLARYTSGEWSLPRIASFFLSSREFVETYGQPRNRAFVGLLYENVLGRQGDAGGIDYWVAELKSGMSRPTLLLRFSESPENVDRSRTTQPGLGPFNEGVTGPWDCEPAATPGCQRYFTEFGSLKTYYVIGDDGQAIPEVLGQQIGWSWHGCPNLKTVTVDYFDWWIDTFRTETFSFEILDPTDLNVMSFASSCAEVGPTKREAVVRAWDRSSDLHGAVLLMEHIEVPATPAGSCEAMWGSDAAPCSLDIDSTAFAKSEADIGDPYGVMRTSTYSWRGCDASSASVTTNGPEPRLSVGLDPSGIAVTEFGSCDPESDPSGFLVAVTAESSSGSARYRSFSAPSGAECATLYPGN